MRLLFLVVTCSCLETAVAAATPLMPDALMCAIATSSHILVVTEGDKVDGVVFVLDSWKGDVPKGELLKLDRHLCGRATTGQRIYDPREDLLGEPRTHPTRVTCSRMLLFLNHDGNEWTPAVQSSYGLTYSTVCQAPAM